MGWDRYFKKNILHSQVQKKTRIPRKTRIFSQENLQFLEKISTGFLQETPTKNILKHHV